MAENLIANLPFLDRSYAPFLRFILSFLDVRVARRRISRPIFHIFHTPHEKLSIHHTTLLSREAGAINAICCTTRQGLIFKLLFWHQRGSIGGRRNPIFAATVSPINPRIFFPLFDIRKWLLNKCSTVRVNAIWNSLHAAAAAAGYVGDATLKRCRPTARPGLGDIKLA